MIQKGQGFSKTGQDKNESSVRWGHDQAAHSSPAHSGDPHHCQSGAPCTPLLTWENSFLLGDEGCSEAVAEKATGYGGRQLSWGNHAEAARADRVGGERARGEGKRVVHQTGAYILGRLEYIMRDSVENAITVHDLWLLM